MIGGFIEAPGNQMRANASRNSRIHRYGALLRHPSLSSALEKAYEVRNFSPPMKRGILSMPRFTSAVPSLSPENLAVANPLLLMRLLTNWDWVQYYVGTSPLGSHYKMGSITMMRLGD